jgi:hypothetical protein
LHLETDERSSSGSKRHPAFSASLNPCPTSHNGRTIAIGVKTSLVAFSLASAFALSEEAAAIPKTTAQMGTAIKSKRMIIAITTVP